MFKLKKSTSFSALLLGGIMTIGACICIPKNTTAHAAEEKKLGIKMTV